MQEKEEQNRLYNTGIRLINTEQRRFLYSNEIVTIKAIEPRGFNNAIITVEEDPNFEMWYSQLTRKYWDENGNTYTQFLILQDKKYDLFDLPLSSFKEECSGKKLKAIHRGSYYYLTHNADRRFQNEIMEQFKLQNYSQISGRYMLGLMIDLEVIS